MRGQTLLEVALESQASTSMIAYLHSLELDNTGPQRLGATAVFLLNL